VKLNKRYLGVCIVVLFTFFIFSCQQKPNDTTSKINSDSFSAGAVIDLPSSGNQVLVLTRQVAGSVSNRNTNPGPSSAPALGLSSGVDSDVVNGFGRDLAVSGASAIVGTYPGKALSGAAFIFGYDNQLNQWQEVQPLRANATLSADAEYGKSVAISADYALVSAPLNQNGIGAVAVFKKDSLQNTWYEITRLSPPVNQNVVYQEFGREIAISANTIAISSYAQTSGESSLSGIVHLYDLKGDNIQLQTSVTSDSPQPQPSFGARLSLIEEALMVGADQYDGTGAVFSYQRAAGVWTPQSLLVPVDNAIQGFGRELALNGDSLAVSAIDNTDQRGNVFIYREDRASKQWIEQQRIISEDNQTLLGSAVAMAGDILALGATSNGVGSGLSYLLHRDANQWQLVNTVVANQVDNPSFGFSLALNHQFALISSPKQLDSQRAFMGEVLTVPLPSEAVANAPSGFFSGGFQQGGGIGGQGVNNLPDDPNQFLSLVTRNSPVLVDDEQSARAYYRTVDPQNIKTSFNRWRRAVGFNQGEDAFAVYINGADLGFARRMYSRVNDDGSIASYVENYATLQDAFNTQGLIATVAMEVAPPVNDPLGEKFVSFYTFDGNGQRVLGADLDGRGFKFQPGLCTVCHGGVTKPLVNGRYPDNGDIGSLFLPYDLATFVFANNSRRFSRAAQEDEIKTFNEIVLLSYDLMTPQISTVAPIEAIEGWYGGVGLPSPTFNEFFVPEGWLPPLAPASAAELYEKVIGPNCRACHLQRGLLLQTDLDLATFDKFLSYADVIEEMVFNQGVMPLAKLTFENFWSDPNNAQLLAEHLPNFSNFSLNTATGTTEPGQPIADAGLSRDSAMRRVRLNGRGSLFADEFRWNTLQTPPGSNVQLNRSRSAAPNFTPDVAGDYTFQLEVSRGRRVSEPSFVTISASAVESRISFSNDIVPILTDDCLICHTDSRVKNFTNDEGLFPTVFELVNFVNPDESLLISKPSGLHHNGLARPGFVSPDTIDRELMLRWIAEGARNN